LLLFVANGFDPDSTAPIRNPLGRQAWRETLDLIGLLGLVALVVCIGAGVFAVISRYRRSQGITRRQMQVFTTSAVTIAVGTLIGYFAYDLGWTTVAQLLLASVSLFVPLAIGMAVLKYRLYELDRIFKRTVTYSIVAAVLIGVYALAVVALQAVLGADDSLSVAASTLAAVALFNPVRHRVQAFIERHFDRTRYNASVEVEEFSSRMLQELDLDQLNADLAGVVDRTLRPHRMSVWLRAG
jgi:drug/metabolite transporter (DMT)-like permease